MTEVDTAKRPRKRTPGPKHTSTVRYFNRELSWLEFNRRVLEEALDTGNPLLERVRFLSIFASNLDEFFMIRVSGLRRQLEGEVLEAPPDGMTPREQLSAIRERVLPMLDTSSALWHDDLLPKLTQVNIRVLHFDQLKGKQRKLLRRLFKERIFPVLTPLATDPSHPFPHISNLSINLAVIVEHPEQGRRFARLKVPAILPRLLRVPDEERADDYERLGLEEEKAPNFIWMEELVAANLDLLFPGCTVTDAHPFRVTRDADLDIEEDEAADLLDAMTEVVGQRQFGSAVRLEVDEAMPANIRDLLVQNLGLEPYQVYTTRAPIGFSDLSQLPSLERPALKFPPFQPMMRPQPHRDESIFSMLRRHRHILLYHPFDSFHLVVDFLRAAARDEHVLAIKQTLYRVGPDSPIVQALREARENGKQVSVLVELKARFDEENNIVWARALEQAGVHVVYGVMGLKTHAKICLVVRREHDGIRRYVHLSTGNYNPITARIYTDVGLFTCEPSIGEDGSDLFNALTGYSLKEHYRNLLVAPRRMRTELLRRIRREIDMHRQHGDGHITFKCNALVDKACIDALYKASQAGVKIDLQVRGICGLVPGVPGLSETISVTSIVGRFLEHSRIYYFFNHGEEDILLGSADLMPRNLDGRVETLFPVEDPTLRRAIRDDILFLHLRDTVKARRLLPDGTYERVQPAEGEAPLNSQEWLLENGGRWRQE